MERSDLDLVLKVRDGGSLAAAADALGVVPSVVTKRLSALESRLGQRLFERTTRRLVLTREGESLCGHARDLLDRFTAVEAEMSERQQSLSGTVKLAATLGFGRLWVGPTLAEFQRAHPQLRIDLRLGEELPDLSAEGFDGAVWLWSVQSRHAADWLTRRLARNQRVLVASPAYLASRSSPQVPADLERHACLRVNEHEDASRPAVAATFWNLRHERDGTQSRVRVEGPLSSNSGELVRDWCLSGHGIMLRSLWDVAPHLAAGTLVRVLPRHVMSDADIHWIAPRQPRTPRRVQLLVEALAARFRSEPWKSA
ncbi:LysR substrate-binding domain-containing protein [Variovorax dokdonensis]|uniref:LysR substrate-binding domain-containing protein n=1 Tax=Variovorax dokdonensis TaxID=344883 RepID=A0ABT7NES3_9BURK|nr:LysR substrate-binding domain-containing protein [Variovorax dokdonensis]MDM0046360.1 LysR substrate-binding domain-containing protein [Variovorax dokdonensis]